MPSLGPSSEHECKDSALLDIKVQKGSYLSGVAVIHYQQLGYDTISHTHKHTQINKKYIYYDDKF